MGEFIVLVEFTNVTERLSHNSLVPSLVPSEN